jgi:hypothetical protein
MGFYKNSMVYLKHINKDEDLHAYPKTKFPLKNQGESLLTLKTTNMK